MKEKIIIFTLVLISVLMICIDNRVYNELNYKRGLLKITKSITFKNNKDFKKRFGYGDAIKAIKDMGDFQIIKIYDKQKNMSTMEFKVEYLGDYEEFLYAISKVQKSNIKQVKSININMNGKIQADIIF